MVSRISERKESGKLCDKGESPVRKRRKERSQAPEYHGAR